MPHDTIRYRSIFVSDFHIGAKKFAAPALLDFLRTHQCDYLYLVGDIIDGWKLSKRWYWTESTSQIFDELFRKASEGTKIIYITGNHDEQVREYNIIKRLKYARRMGIQIKNRIVHKNADGREFLVIHGDQFDRAILRGTLSRLSDRLYDMAVDLMERKRPVNIEIDGKIKRFSMAKFLSYHGQMALNILNNFESALAREAKRSDVDGIICGHTHIPALKHFRHITYANCGSWLSGKPTAVIEKDNGSLELVDWQSDACETDETFCAQSYVFRPATLRLMQLIRKTWPSPHEDRQTAMQPTYKAQTECL